MAAFIVAGLVVGGAVVKLLELSNRGLTVPQSARVLLAEDRPIIPIIINGEGRVGKVTVLFISCFISSLPVV